MPRFKLAMISAFCLLCLGNPALSRAQFTGWVGSDNYGIKISETFVDTDPANVEDAFALFAPGPTTMPGVYARTSAVDARAYAQARYIRLFIYEVDGLPGQDGIDTPTVLDMLYRGHVAGVAPLTGGSWGQSSVDNLISGFTAPSYDNHDEARLAVDTDKKNGWQASFLLSASAHAQSAPDDPFVITTADGTLDEDNP